MYVVWGGVLVIVVWCFLCMNGLCFSVVVYVYDIYEYGGDWWLNEKLVDVVFIYMLMEMGKCLLMECEIVVDKIYVICCGLDRFFEWKLF